MTEPLIVRRDLNDQVYDAIQDRLLTRSFGAGAKLTLQGLADALGVSRSPVHHALTRLVSEGLVAADGRGYFVRPLTVKAMDDAHDVRLALELHAAEATVARVSDAQLAELRRLMERTIEPVEGQVITDVRAYMLANKEFHEFQVALAGNELMLDLYRRLSVHRLMERVFVARRAAAAGDSSREHAHIVEAYEAGDLAAARAALRANVETGRRLARAVIEDAGGEI